MYFYSCFLRNLVNFLAFVHGMLSAKSGPVSVKKIWLHSLAMSILLVYVLLFCLKHVGNRVLNLCLDIISLIAFRVFAALNLYLSKSCSWCNLCFTNALLKYYVACFLLVQHVLYSA